MTDSGQFAETAKPAVSVIIPAYNAAPFITETLDSVFRQTFKHFEVILINDGSPDTEELEQAIRPYRDRIVYLKQANRGPSAARNAGIRRAGGEFVAFLDADDWWSPEYLAEQMKLFEQTPSLGLVYSDLLEGDVPYSRACPSRGPVTFEGLVTESCSIPTSFAVARRQAVLDAGLFDERLWRCEDFDLWLRMAYRGAQISYHPKALGRRQSRPSGLAADKISMLQSMARVLTKIGRELSLTAETSAVLRRESARAQANADLERGKVHLREGRLDQAQDAFRSANVFFRRRKLALILLALRFSPRLAGSAFGIWGRLVAGRQYLSRYTRRELTQGAWRPESPREI
jgi:glycosyltransferase involved in cell wall biosynthesis